jgi:hypothetical protein
MADGTMEALLEQYEATAAEELYVEAKRLYEEALRMRLTPPSCCSMAISSSAMPGTPCARPWLSMSAPSNSTQPASRHTIS